jgi:hypothetical protein
VVVVLSVFLSHLHYSIDVVGAYAITFSIFVLREGLVLRQPVPTPATTSHRMPTVPLRMRG